MTLELIKVTPAMAAKLVANPHPRQRKRNNNKIATYSRRLERGEWKDGAPAQPMLIDDKTGQLFNGLQRCSAVINTGKSMVVWMDKHSDAEAYFAVVDENLPRKPYQFIQSGNASTRASGARIMLWYRNNFERPLGSASNFMFSTEEILTEVEQNVELFDRLVPLALGIYNRTGLSTGIALAALALADEEGFGEQAVFFAEKIIDPQGLSMDDPAWRLVDRQSKQIHRTRHRQPMEDWTLFVRHLNAELTDTPLPSKIVTATKLWPAIGETDNSFMKRNHAVRIAKSSMTNRARWAARKAGIDPEEVKGAATS